MQLSVWPGVASAFIVVLPKCNYLALMQEHIHTRHDTLGATTVDDVCTGAILDHPGAGNVVGMDVRFNGKDERQAQLFNSCEIAFDVLDDGINDDRLAGIAVGHDVGAAFRPVVDILDTIHVQENGHGIGLSHGHGSHSEDFRICDTLTAHKKKRGHSTFSGRPGL